MPDRDLFGGDILFLFRSAEEISHCAESIPTLGTQLSIIASVKSATPEDRSVSCFPNTRVKISQANVKFRYFSKDFFRGLLFGEAYIRRGLFSEGNFRFKIGWAYNWT